MNILILCAIHFSFLQINSGETASSSKSVSLDFIYPDFKSLLSDTDSISFEDLEIRDLSKNWVALDWGLLQSGATVVKINDSTFLIKCYTNLPLNGVDSPYIKFDIIHFYLSYNSTSSGSLTLDTSYNPPLVWDEKDILKTKELWNSMSNNPEYRKIIYDLNAYQCGEILYLNYYLLYSILKGDVDCLEYFMNFKTIFPAMNELTLKEEYSSNYKILKYYNFIE